MTVEIDVLAEGGTVVGKEFQVVSDKGLAPGLGGIGHIGVAGLDQRSGICSLHRAVGLVRVAVLQAEVGPSIFVAQTDIAGRTVREAIAGLEDTGFDFKRCSLVVVLQLKVHHPGNGVGTVLGRGPVAQHFHLSEGDGRDRRRVLPLRRIGNAIAEPVNHRGAVAALAIDQYQRVVGC